MHTNDPAPFDPSSKPDPASGATPLDQDRFIAVLAHELRNPLAPIRSGLDLLASDKVDDAGRRETVAMMQRQLNHLVRLMDDLLDAARLSSGRLPVRREPVPLRQVLDAAIESIEPALQAKEQTLRTSFLADDVYVCADPVRLAQAFANILSRNVKKSSTGGTIAVDVETGDGQLRLTFSDDGPPMSDQEAANAFVLFPGGQSKDPDDGLSIGLALVKGLIEANGGTVQVGNPEGASGTLFTVTLPRTAPAVPASRPPAAGTRSDWLSHRLLIVDDNLEAAEALGLLFELDGMTIRLATDGPSAVDEAHDFEPEVILMDLGLPGFDGMEAVKRIRRLQLQVRPYIVALTGWGAEPDRHASHRAGVDLHLVKPVTYELLTDALRRGLDARTEHEHSA